MPARCAAREDHASSPCKTNASIAVVVVTHATTDSGLRIEKPSPESEDKGV